MKPNQGPVFAVFLEYSDGEEILICGRDSIHYLYFENCTLIFDCSIEKEKIFNILDYKRTYLKKGIHKVIFIFSKKLKSVNSYLLIVKIYLNVIFQNLILLK